MKKLISVLLALALLTALTTSYALAAAQPVTLDLIPDKTVGDHFNITGTSTAQQVTVRIINPDGDVISNNQVFVINGTFSSPFKVPGDKGIGTFMVQAINGDGSVKTSTTFKVSLPSEPEQVEKPTALPVAGTYTSAQSVILSTATAGAEIHYTVDGSTPTSASAIYSGAIPVATSTTIKAIAIKNGMRDSDVATFSYTISTRPVDNGSNGGPATGEPTGGTTGGTASGTDTTPPTALVTVTVNPNDVAAAVKNMKEGIVSLKTIVTAGAIDVKATVPVTALITAAGVEKVNVDLGIAKITLDVDVLKSSGKDNPQNVELSVKKADVSSLPAAAKAAIGTNPVYDLNLSADGKKITSFASNMVKVELKYALKPGENPNNVVIYYIDGNGSLQVVPNCSYNSATGMVEFYPQHFSKYAPVYVTVALKDISGVAWAKESINALAAREIISAADGKFNPSANIKRAELIDFLMKASGLVDNTAVSTFKDVGKGSAYYQSIASAEKLGITNGIGKGSFGVNDEITRQDMAVWMYKIALLKKADISSGKAIAFADNDSIAPYARDAVDAMTKIGLLKGVGGNKFMPKGKATRAQGAVVSYSVFKIVNDF